jgi:ABC-type multidrug transport system fused ATPase/permease subunit
VKKEANIYKQCLKGKNKFIYYLIAVMNVVVAGMNVYVAVILERLINISAKGDSISVLFQYILKMILYLFVLSAFSYVLFKLKNIFLYKVLTEYKNKVFSTILSKEISTFNRYNTSDYVSGLSNDIAIAEVDYIKALFNVIEYAVFLIGGILVMIYLNIFVFIGIMVLFAIPISVTAIFSNKLEPEQNKVSETSTKFISCLQDVFAGFSDIKLFKAEEPINDVFSEINNNFEITKKRRNDVEEKINLFSSVSGSIFIVGVCTIGAYLALRGIISIGAVVACIQAVNYIVNPIQQLPPTLGKINGSKALLCKLEKLAASDKESTSTGKINITEFNDCISLHNVGFGYDKENKVVRNLNHVFEKGKSYAVVGPSGCGKTTLINLLLSFTNEYDGSILVDGNEIKKIHRDSMYRLMSVIQQKVFIFNSSIFNNITMYSNFEEEQIQNAVEMAGLSKLIKEKGLDYNCGENGSNLSGGERQRISIARSVLQKKPILLMDEATAALDAKTSYDIETTILSMNNLTRIVVTHRLDENIMKLYDEILVIKDGSIVEKGSFEKLMELKKNFYALNLVSSVKSELKNIDKESIR